MSAPAPPAISVGDYVEMRSNGRRGEVEVVTNTPILNFAGVQFDPEPGEVVGRFIADIPTSQLKLANAVTITLPYPPTANNLTKNFVRAGKICRVKTDEANNYRASVQSICMVCRVRPIAGPVSLRLDVYRPRKIGDLDNTIKAIQDAMTGFAWEDDKQIVEIIARRFDDRENPRVEVTVGLAMPPIRPF